MRCKRFVSFLLIIFLLVPLLPWAANGEPSGKRLTLMVYMTGSDLESAFGAATSDIHEMRTSGFDSSQINVVVMTGGSQQWSMAMDAGQTVILELRGKRMRMLDSRPALNMGDADTLSGFLHFCVEQFPAEEYALILWDHGGGPMEGVCYDQIFGMDQLTLRELKTALENSPFSRDNPLAWIGFDACMMASVETALCCGDYSRCMIASQETEPSTGWDYSFLRFAGDDVSGIGIGRHIIDAYMAASDSLKPMTLSCVDLEKIPSVIQAMDFLFSDLADLLSAQSFSDLSNYRRDAKSFGQIATLSDYDLVDLWHLSELYGASEKADILNRAVHLRDALEQAIVYNGSNQENAHGLSVYAPYTNKNSFTAKWLNEYRGMAAQRSGVNGYLTYMDRFARYWLGEQLADWRSLDCSVLPFDSGVQPLQMTLTQDQLDHFAYAQVLILRERGVDDSYLKIFESPLLTPEGNVLRYDYNFSALYAVDQNGKPQTDSLPFFIRDGHYFLYASFESMSIMEAAIRKLTDSSTQEYRFINSFLCFYQSPETGKFEKVNTILVPSDDMIAQTGLAIGKYDFDFDTESWPCLRFDGFIYPCTPIRNADGQLLPFDQWSEITVANTEGYLLDPEGNIIKFSDAVSQYSLEELLERGFLHFGEVDQRKPWELALLPLQLSGDQLYAQFVVTDTQGFQSAGELIPLHNAHLISTTPIEQVVFEQKGDDPIRITLNKIDVIDAALGGVNLYFTVENECYMDMTLYLDVLMLNDEELDSKRVDTHIKFAANSVKKDVIHIGAKDLPAMEDPILHSLSFFPRMVEYPEYDPIVFVGLHQELNVDIDLSPLLCPNE